MSKRKCPCGSNKNYNDCCGRFISGNEVPNSPEQLMRSRYTAYTKANINYIKQTMHGKALENFNAKEAKVWAKQANWLGLEIIKASVTVLNKGFVEFIAKYYYDKQVRQIHENSEFHLIDDRWYYVSGTHN